jgi:glutathione S-transferase
VKLYGMGVSHPSRAARAMLSHKGIEHDLVSIPAGMQPVVLRVAGFRGRTVPALKVDGRRIQGSLAISRALEELKPDPPLFPGDRRAAVEEAEAWGERELQPLPRRLFRWGVAHRPHLARWMARLAGMPAPGVTGTVSMPLARYFAYLSRANDESVRSGIARVPEAIDHVDALIAEGTIGQDDLTAADFQIAASIHTLLGFSEFRDVLGARPATELARRIFPKPVAEMPPFLPEEWLGPLRG